MILPSELIINADGSVFHLHVRPGDLARKIILVGDPLRVDVVALRFDSVEFTASNREFRAVTGTVNGERLSVVSTGIGCDNIDIVITEIDALFNVDFDTRELLSEHTSLQFVRLGTCGAVDKSLRIGDYLASRHSVGIDGLAYFYAFSERVRDEAFEVEFIRKTSWNPHLARPYAVLNDEELLGLFSDFTIPVTTVSAGGFYGPQGRCVRLGLSDSDYLAHIESAGVGNFEMEGAAIAFLGRMLGHRTLTICAAIAQRTVGDSKPDYQQIVDKLIDLTVERLSKK